jgi:hypothetical protein
MGATANGGNVRIARHLRSRHDPDATMGKELSGAMWHRRVTVHPVRPLPDVLAIAFISSRRVTAESDPLVLLSSFLHGRP